MACLGFLTANAQKVTVADVYATKGGTAYFTVNLQGGKAETYTSLQFNVEFPDEGFTTTGSKVLNTAEWQDVSATVGDVDDAGVAIIPVSSAEKLTSGDVDNLISVEFAVAGTLESKTYQVKLTNITFGYGFTDKDVLDDVTFNVIVSDVLTLDENSQVAPGLTKDVCEIKVLRTLKKDEWSTICLPFYMSKEEAINAFGEGYQLADFYDYTTTKDDSGVVEIKVEFTDPADFEEEDGLYANVPYILKPTKDVEEFVVEEEIDEIIANPTKNSKTKKSGKYIGKFIGTYVAKTVVPAKSAFLSGNKFWYSAGKTKMKAFRAYFTFNDVLADYDAASTRISFFVGDGENQTQIQVPELMPNDGEYYNLNGLRVETPSKGIYIKDGKKVVVK